MLRQEPHRDRAVARVARGVEAGAVGGQEWEGEVVRIIIVAYALALMLALSAQAAEVDWKLYGGASVAGPSLCFYDAASVTRASNSCIRVWTKCLAQKDLDGVNRTMMSARKLWMVPLEELPQDTCAHHRY